MPCSSAHSPMACDLGGGVDRAGRVGRRDEDEHLGPVGARGLELLDGGPVAGGLVGHDLDRDAAGQPDRLRVGRPVGRGEDDLVARVEEGGERVVEGLLAAVGDEHLARRDLVAGVAQGLGRDGRLAARAARRPGCSGATAGRRRPRSRPRRCSPGVGKSGSPAPNPMTGRPAALRALALASTARVADSAIAAMRREMRASVMGPSLQPRPGRGRRGSPAPGGTGLDPPRGRTVDSLR